MLLVHSIFILALAGTAAAQTNATGLTNATQASAPVAIATQAPGPTSSTMSSGSARSRSRVGITGVRQPRGRSRRPARAATAAVQTTGYANPSAPDQKIDLPGIALFHNPLGITTGTPIQVHLQDTIDSGHAKNGDIIRGTLTAPAGSAPAGAPVELTVVAAAVAGQLNSFGELSVQVIKINGVPVLSQVVTAFGEEGKRILPDAAPERGTEAVLSPDKPLTLPAS